MEHTYDSLGQPGIFRNDRLWIAGDHVVDPRVNDVPKVRALIDASERAKRVFKMTDYQGMNVREAPGVSPSPLPGELLTEWDLVHHSPYRVLSRTRTAGHDGYRFRFAYLLFGSSRLPRHWNGRCRRYSSSGDGRDMVQGTRVS